MGCLEQGVKATWAGIRQVTEPASGSKRGASGKRAIGHEQGMYVCCHGACFARTMKAWPGTGSLFNSNLNLSARTMPGKHQTVPARLLRHPASQRPAGTTQPDTLPTHLPSCAASAAMSLHDLSSLLARQRTCRREGPRCGRRTPAAAGAARPWLPHRCGAQPGPPHFIDKPRAFIESCRAREGRRAVCVESCVESILIVRDAAAMWCEGCK